MKAIATRRQQVLSQAEFTSEDILPHLPQGVKDQLSLHPNALGAAIHTAARAGVIIATGRYVCATRAEARSRKIALWCLRPTQR